MVSTVTTSTVTTVTTIAAMGLGFVIGIAAIVALVVFLTVKELVSASQFPHFRLLGRYLNVGVLPLVIAFGVIVVVKVGETLT